MFKTYFPIIALVCIGCQYQPTPAEIASQRQEAAQKAKVEADLQQGIIEVRFKIVQIIDDKDALVIIPISGVDTKASWLKGWDTKGSVDGDWT